MLILVTKIFQRYIGKYFVEFVFKFQVFLLKTKSFIQQKLHSKQIQKYQNSIFRSKFAKID